MPIDPAVALGAHVGTVSFSWTPSDVALYNLAVGAGADPMDVVGLQYVDDAAPAVLPTFATVAASFHETAAPSVSFPGVQIDLAKVVHGSQSVTVHRPIPASGSATTTTRISELQDKGSAAVIIQESETTADSGEKLWTATSSIFAKGEGGFGGERGTSSKVAYPDRPADTTLTVKTLPQQALLYRLCGDRNPLHSDPEFAKQAGFDRPIMHGLGTYGIVCRTVIDQVLGGEVDAVTSFGTTFGGILFPGESLQIDLWRDDNQLLISADCIERGAPVLKNVVLTTR